MKCELCHKKDAEAAIHLDGDGEEQELYVCRECANRERVSRQKKSQRTRKSAAERAPAEPSEGGDEPPPILGAILDAVHGMVSDLAQAAEEAGRAKPEEEMKEFPCARAPQEYRIGEALHLEGLHLIGELEPVHRAMRALGMRLAGVEADGVRDTGHAYRLMYSGSAERARRVADDLLREERNARNRLRDEMPRVFGDSLCRSLAILKNCRLLSPGELFDLLSPLRLAAIGDMLDGIGRSEVEKMLLHVDLTSKEDAETQQDRDRMDAERADEMNRRFEDVVLNERAEREFL